MGFLSDFRSFAIKGNVVDLAVGVIIGAAFGKIVTAVVDDLIMPSVSLLAPDGKSLVNQYFVFKAAKEGDVYHSLEEARKAGANVLAYGHFLQTVFDFLIVALSIFVMIQSIEKLKRKKAEVAPVPAAPSPSEQLLVEIRDELRKR